MRFNHIFCIKIDSCFFRSFIIWSNRKLLNNFSFTTHQLKIQIRNFWITYNYFIIITNSYYFSMTSNIISPIHITISHEIIGWFPSYFSWILKKVTIYSCNYNPSWMMGLPILSTNFRGCGIPAIRILFCPSYKFYTIIIIFQINPLNKMFLKYFCRITI